MIQFGSSPPGDQANQWRYQLDSFVEEHQNALAALAWGLLQEWDNHQDAIGIDLQPQPHFVRCSRQAIEELNKKVNRQIQEILGVLDGYNPQEEVVMIAIAKGQLKLIHFKPDPFPPVCFEEVSKTLEELIQTLEELMAQKIVILTDS
ncbi:conserved hypothetical protein [Rippkaea orientalis PCC 8801]|uniref:Chaperone protein CcmS domain-containing protein n=1 Tax=Rippkaea orientalis (strain PCC 8801 / RF-1) TaxID=41431 RepID=B7K2W7_RIPO1|nr:hypothetical protein [Rippkaea orientalis]ACK67668.1 conserved hypothetical protein [Rippkaea orientalis PCC 8801]